MKSTISRPLETRLITALVQSNPREDVVPLLNSSPDWRYIFQTAEEHRVTALLARKMKTDYAELIPAEVFEEFQARQENIAKLNFGRTTHLIKLVRVLQDNDIPVIAYKGTALAATAYRDIALRQFTDIDLLIDKKDFPEIKKLFLEIGCRPDWELTAKQERAVLNQYYEYPFVYPENRTLIELHWRFTQPFFVFDYDYDRLWTRVQPLNLYGKIIPTLSPEDSLIVLCVHGSKHFWHRLSWICDIAKSIENTRIDWETVSQRAEKTGSLRMLWLGLLVAKEILNVEPPDEIFRRIAADRLVKQVFEKIKNTIFSSDPRPANWIETAGIHLGMRERRRDKFKYSGLLLTTKLRDSLFLPMGRPQ